MMEIQSESWKLEVMIIPSKSYVIHTISHSKSPTSHPHSNENQNRNTHNSNTISHSRHETVCLTIPNPAPPFKSQFYLHYLIITIPANPTVSTSYSHHISQSSTKYPHSKPSPQITLSHPQNHIMSLYNSLQILPPLKTLIPLIQHQHTSSFTSNPSTHIIPPHTSHPKPSNWRQPQSPFKQH